MTLDDPVLKLGVLTIHPFGLFVAIGLVVGYVVALWRVIAAGLPARRLPGTFLIVVPGSFVGARLAYVALHPVAGQQGLQGILSIWQGGFMLIGGLVAGAFFLALVSWARDEALWRWADAVAPAASLGLAVGMLGLPFGGEGWGQPTRGPLFMTVDPARRPIEFINVAHFQPIFAYEAIVFAVLALVLLIMSMLGARRSGAGYVALAFLFVSAMAYGALRPLSLDASTARLVLQTQVICAALAAIALALLVTRYWRSRHEAIVTREIQSVQLGQAAARPPFSDALRTARPRTEATSVNRRPQ